MSKEENELLKDPDRSYTEMNRSFHYDVLDQSLDLPTFEFSSPISSIGSHCSSPDRDQTVQAQFLSQVQEDFDEDETGDYVSLEDLKSQISPPSDDECSGFNSCSKIDVLETIFEDCYLETPPKTPGTPKLKKPRRFRVNLNNFEEYKENIQTNNKQHVSTENEPLDK